eukprot:TRINITY_DN13373_c0_g1_i2.p1 TRINITY_DN13373_c0_g1~~TRINITY_DN13373_c0_g1_i2.p1  ORF type:complete len:1098 (+),score=153.07 TRINITY_DN13373_c0_g1_i2:96-3296(+)
MSGAPAVLRWPPRPFWRARLQVFVALSSLLAPVSPVASATNDVLKLPTPPEGYVCQVMTPQDTPLQTLLGIRCEVVENVCKCTSAIASGITWMLLTVELNASLSATPGEWLIMDSSQRCAASFDGKRVVAQPCPPGFYCEGDRQPPKSCSEGDLCPGRTPKHGRRCPFGYFCPLPGLEKQPCPDGTLCRQGSSAPSPCGAGIYCRDQHFYECPQGHFCPFASVTPRRCSVLASCPPGSKTPGLIPVAATLLCLIACICYLTARYYEELVRRGVLACVVCSALVGLMCFVDEILAGFLFLILVAVAANWILLRLAVCPWYIPQFLVLVTLGTALIALWVVNPPWSLLVGGLALSASIGWLMSRQHMAAVCVGRVLLLAFFTILLVTYSRIDPGFTRAIGVFFLATCFGLLVFWIVEQRRQSVQGGRLVLLPFNTRWRATAQRAFAFEGASSFLAATPPPSPLYTDAQNRATSNSAAVVAAPTTSAEGPVRKAPVNNSAVEASCSSIESGELQESSLNAAGLRRSGRQGVSFLLQEVNFDLPDGKRLLRDIDLSIAPGRRVAVMGPSGSGKTTLLAVLSGRASYGRVEGRLLVGGHSAEGLRMLRNVTGFVPQDDVLHGELTVIENIRFQAALRLPAGTTHEELTDVVTQVASDLNLVNVLHNRVGTPERRGVSGGQRKRVSIAMELVAKPLLLFADEPTSGLDSTTSHEVVRCLKSAAGRLGATVIAVIHQPRYETLLLFDDLALLGVGGCLVYGGVTDRAVDHFKHNMKVNFPPNANPADILLDAIQPPLITNEGLRRFADAWKVRNQASGDDKHQQALSQQSQEQFLRARVPFFRAALIYMDRSMLQSLRAYQAIFINQGLSVITTAILCFILEYERLDQFMMQATLAALFLMLLQGVAAQRIFGNDLLITWREARVGMPMVAYFVAKDLAALFEVTLSAAVFAVAYGSLSGMLQPLLPLFAGSWAFVYTVFGLSYVFSIVLPSGAAQMSAVVSSFIAFCMSGIYQPQLNVMAAMFNGRGWMIPALSPIRWLYGYLLTHELPHATELTLEGARSNLQWTVSSLES